MTVGVDKGISMNGQPMGGVSMNGETLPVAQGTPIASAPKASPPPPTMATMSGTGAVPTIPMHEQQKIGAKCCGCCCDFRRAVIILDTILMILALMSLVAIAVPVSERLQLEGEIDDDEVIEVIDESFMVNNIISGVGFACLAVPVYGAMTYNIPMVGYGIFWLVASYIASIIVGVIYTQRADDIIEDESIRMPFLNWIGQAIVVGIFIYPHVGLISEINNGIMSKETYPREEYSCCCGPVGR